MSMFVFIILISLIQDEIVKIGQGQGQLRLIVETIYGSGGNFGQVTLNNRVNTP